MDDERDYKVQHTILQLILAIFLFFALITTVFCVVSNWGHLVQASLDTDNTYLINTLLVLSIIVYSVYGYSKGAVYYNACVSLFEFSLIAHLMQLAKYLNSPADSVMQTYAVVCFFLCIAALIIVFAFANVYKKNKKAGLILGGIIILGELIYSIISVVISINVYEDPMDIVNNQMFVHFFAASAMIIAYAVRTHWSEAGKPKNFIEDI